MDAQPRGFRRAPAGPGVAAQEAADAHSSSGPRFSSPGAVATSWESVLEELADADLCWIVTVRGDGRPHVTPLLAVVLDGVAHVFAVEASDVFAFGKGKTYSQTRWSLA